MNTFSDDLKIKGLKEHFALIYAPRRKRERYPENTVQTVPTQQAALDGAQPDKQLYPARVRGPFRSSEGFKLYYLVAWLDS